ncbi:hypothetical protein AA0488_0004 [Kozakia baliensis NRIC 0488]|nr:hypothetical protein AA0488_0004 [Kozakia baliensis NRIC 0488]GEL65480.1 hypothetical protein KBA01_27660 [Kozakia baliensis]
MEMKYNALKTMFFSYCFQKGVRVAVDVDTNSVTTTIHEYTGRALWRAREFVSEKVSAGNAFQSRRDLFMGHWCDCCWPCVVWTIDRCFYLRFEEINYSSQTKKYEKWQAE